MINSIQQHVPAFIYGILFCIFSVSYFVHCSHRQGFEVVILRIPLFNKCLQKQQIELYGSGGPFQSYVPMKRIIGPGALSQKMQCLVYLWKYFRFRVMCCSIWVLLYR